MRDGGRKTREAARKGKFLQGTCPLANYNNNRKGKRESKAASKGKRESERD